MWVCFERKEKKCGDKRIVIVLEPVSLVIVEG